MYYALISSHDDSGDGCHRLFFGTLAQIGSSLLDHCSEGLLREELENGSTLDDLEENYACDFDSYHDLADSDDPSEDAVRSFDFYFSGASVRVIALTTTYADLAHAFNTYAADTCLGSWRMLPGNVTGPAELACIDLALIRAGDPPAPYFESIEEE